MSRISNLNTKNTPTHNFLNEKTKKLFLLLSLIGIMMIFYLCNLNHVYIYGTCETYSLLQIPVIIGACIGGPSTGLILTLIYGIIDMAYASFSIELTDVLLSPFAVCDLYTYRIHGNFSSIIMCFLPKIILALVAGFVFKYFKNFKGFSQLGLSAICTLLAISFSFSTFISIFNTLFTSYLADIPKSNDFIVIINSSTTIAFFQKISVNIIINPIAIFAISNIAHFD